ncbi:hypothetical protein ACJX0J_041329 [Zea mays]
MEFNNLVVSEEGQNYNHQNYKLLATSAGGAAADVTHALLDGPAVTFHDHTGILLAPASDEPRIIIV